MQENLSKNKKYGIMKGHLRDYDIERWVKMMKKKMLAVVVGLCTVISLVGCGNKGISNDKIKITQYKGLEVDKVEVVEVTDEDIESSIKSTLQTMKQPVTDRAVESGDFVTIDYAGKVDGEAFDGGTAEDAELEIGSGTFIPGFEDAIIGHNIGETFDIDVTFPEEYKNNEALSGKAAVFTITLDAISAVPELTKELLSDLSTTATTIEEYKEEVKKDLQKSNEETAKSNLEQLVWAALIENCVIENYPEDKLSEVTSEIESQFSYFASMYGTDVDTLIQNYYGVSLDEMAKNMIKQEFAIELIAEKEKLTLSDEDYEKGLAEYAEQYGYDDVKEFEEMAGKEEVEKMLQQKKVGDFLVENCKQVEKSDK